MATYYFKVRDYIKYCNIRYGMGFPEILTIVDLAFFNSGSSKDRFTLQSALSSSEHPSNDSYIKIAYLKPDKNKELISIGITPEEYKAIKASLRPKPVKKYQRIDFFAQTNALANTPPTTP